MTRTSLLLPACLLASALGGPALAQSGSVSANVGYSGTVDCDQPVHVKNFPISGEGTITLSQDRRASLQMTTHGATTSQLRIATSLGGKPTPAPGGTASLRVVSSSQLRAVWDLPNNSVIVTLRATKTACTLSVDYRLKGGALKYSMYDGGAFYFCNRPRITRTTCTER